MEKYAFKAAELLKSLHLCLPQVVCIRFLGTVLSLRTHTLMNVTPLLYTAGEKPESEMRQRSQPGRQVK